MTDTISQEVDAKLHKIKNSDDDPEEKIDEIIKVTRDLAGNVDDLLGEVQSYEDTVKIMETRLDGVCNRLDKAEEEIEETWRESEFARSDIRTRVTRLEEDASVSADPTVEASLSRLERILALDEEPKGASEERAVDIADHWDAWSKDVTLNDDYQSLISNKKHNLKTIMEESRDEDLKWNQVKRAMNALEDISDGKFETTETDDQGHLIGLCEGVDIVWDPLSLSEA